MCLFRNINAAFDLRVYVDPFEIAGIIHSFAREKMHQSHSNHEAFVLSKIVLIRGIQSIRFQVLNDLWIVPRDEMFKFYHGEEEEQVIYNERNQAAKVSLDRIFTFAIELRDWRWKHVCVNQHFWKTKASQTFATLPFHFRFCE